MFSLQPVEGHPASKSAEQLSRVLCLYDNAGEHFRPGGNRSTNPCADHLALSRAILFLFDPSQDRKFREHCLCETQSRAGSIASSQQITILHEVARRVREYKLGWKPNPTLRWYAHRGLDEVSTPGLTCFEDEDEDETEPTP